MERDVNEKHIELGDIVCYFRYIDDVYACIVIDKEEVILMNDFNMNDFDPHTSIAAITPMPAKPDFETALVEMKKIKIPKLINSKIASTKRKNLQPSTEY